MIGSRSRDPFEHVYSEDPALDSADPNFDGPKYFQTFDRKYMPVKPGATPTRFKIRPLSRRRFLAIAGLQPSDRASSTVAYGVVGIENFRLPSGSMLVPEFTGAGQDQHLTAQTLDLIFDTQLFTELMTVIMTASGLDPLADGHSGHSPG